VTYFACSVTCVVRLAFLVFVQCKANELKLPTHQFHLDAIVAIKHLIQSFGIN
jgi:hypothetical protein